jgi:alkylresorcinol/alkylpyrone synthase
MKIAGAAGAFPPHRYHQYVITDALRAHWGEKLPRPELLTRLHSRSGVDYRNLAFSLPEYKRFETWGQSNRAWIAIAEQLGERALDGALERAGFSRHDLDALFVVSITGVASPSLDVRLINRMTLRPDIKRTPIFGLGCVGGAAGLTRAADYVKAYPTQAAHTHRVLMCRPRDEPEGVLARSRRTGLGLCLSVFGGRCRRGGPVQPLWDRRRR